MYITSIDKGQYGEIRPCITCAHHINGACSYFFEVDPVTGEVFGRVKCALLRKDHGVEGDACGSEGKYWEEK